MSQEEPDTDLLGTVRLIQAEAEAALDRQLDQHNIITQRAQSLLGFAGIILGVALGVNDGSANNHLVLGLFAVGIVLFVCVAWFGAQAWTVRELRRDPRPDALRKTYSDAPETWLRKQLTLNLVQSYNENRPIIDDRLKHLRCASLFLIVEVVYLSLVTVLLPYIS